MRNTDNMYLIQICTPLLKSLGQCFF